MTKWKNIKFNAQNIEYETGRATLVKMPNNSEWKGWMFWHPSKLIKTIGGKGYWKSFAYTDEWDFTLFKGNGVYKKEEILSAESIEEAFGVVNESIDAYVETDDSFLEVIEPKKIDKSVEIKESLKR
ncbi:hypothetical protein KG090_00670 [Carnobacteriaceae bacterium zg-ZUI240]|nr:hypothetical protein [Carnobacteriaceae bacterium zg-ZUI240]